MIHLKFLFVKYLFYYLMKNLKLELISNFLEAELIKLRVFDT
jgi:hypothetical protein